MKRKQRFIAALLILNMGMTLFPERVLASEAENAVNQAAATEDGESTAMQPLTDDSVQNVSRENADEQDQSGSGEEEKSLENEAGADREAITEPQDSEKGEISESKPQAAGKEQIPGTRSQEADEEQAEDVPDEENTEELSETDLDDPGRGRLSGREIPAGFLGNGIKTRAAASGITHNKKFSGYTIKQGIDVSKWNGTINWKNVKNAGIEFAFVRTSYRGTKTGALAKDPTAAANMSNAAAAGVKVGAYIFSQAITKAEAVQEAEYLLQTVKGYKITMPLVFDYEYYSGGRFSSSTKLSRRAKTDICLAFCDRIRQAGYTPLVYANKSMFSSDLYAAEITAKYPAWLAHYTTSTDYTGDYVFWQYTSTGRVSGISGNVDMNYWYIKPGTAPSYGTGNTSSSSQVSTPPADAATPATPTTPKEPAEPKAPAVPKLTGKASSYDKIKLSWKKISGASGYVLYRYDSSKKKYNKIKTISSGSTVSYTDSGKSMGTTYKYRIKSYKKENGKTVYSSASGTVSVKTVSSMTGKTNGTNINVRSGPSTLKKSLTKLGINKSVTITGISGSWYRISIKIKGKKKTGYIKKTYVTIISKPTLSASASSKSKIKLKWNKISGASGYQVQRYNSSKKKYVTVKTISKGSTVSYTNSGLKKNTTYKYRIRAYKTVRGKKIYSSYSSVKSAKTKK